jgi:type I restriction-modification system DNA methylase subunit
MDYKKLSDDELIELCKEKSIEYFNSKTKKNYAKSTLISRLNKIDKDAIKPTDETIKEEIVNIEYKNEVIWTLSDEDKKNNDEYKEIENKLLNCIKSCHDCLYSNGSIVGLKASNDIIRIIIFRLLNIIYKNDDIKLEIRNKISVENLEKYEKYLIDIKEFNKSLNIDNDIKLYIMKIIITILPNVFNSDDMIFNMRNYPKNYTTIINKISELIDINNSELFIKLFADTGGNIYEYFTNSYGKGNSSKELGQFFTPFKLINLLLFNIKDYILIDDNYSLYDPCCGSGGLLNRTSSFLNINKNNIYGCEIEKDTIKYALASILFNNNNSLKINILNNCSLSNNKYIFENKKFNLILTNPPFGIKMTYKDLKSKFEEYRDYNFKSSSIKFEDVYPVNTNNGPSLFLQHVIYMLEDNGICGIVLPDGSELSSKSYYNIRKYLIDNCKILKVINVSGGAFNSTGVKTKILIFKKQKGIDNHKNIEFLEINKNCNEVKLIAIADLDKNYSFKLKVNQENIISKYKDKHDIELIEFGQMFDLVEGTIQSSKVVDDENGDIMFISKAEITEETRKIKYQYYNTNALYIAQAFNGNGKCPIRYYKNNSIHSNLLYHIKIKENYIDKINIKYIYYYLLNKQEYIEENYQLGCANKKLDVEEFNLMKIPIPSIEIQNKKVEEIDKLEQSIETMKTRISQIKYEQEYILLIKLREYSNIIYKYLGEICDFIKTGKDINANNRIKGNYPFYGANGIIDYVDNYLFDDIYLLTARTGSLGSLYLSYGKINCSGDVYVIKFNDTINISFIYYYLHTINFQEYRTGSTYPKLNSENLKSINIPIPPIEVQKEIVRILDDINDRMNYDIKHIQLLQSLCKDIIINEKND